MLLGQHFGTLIEGKLCLLCVLFGRQLGELFLSYSLLLLRYHTQKHFTITSKKKWNSKCYERILMHCKSIITVFLLFSSACYHKWQNWLLIQLQLVAFHKFIFSNFKFGWKSVFGWIYGDLFLTKCLKANLYRFFWIFTHFWTGTKKLLVKHYIRLLWNQSLWNCLKSLEG